MLCFPAQDFIGIWETGYRLNCAYWLFSNYTFRRNISALPMIRADNHLVHMRFWHYFTLFLHNGIFAHASFFCRWPACLCSLTPPQENLAALAMLLLPS